LILFYSIYYKGNPGEKGKKGNPGFDGSQFQNNTYFSLNFKNILPNQQTISISNNRELIGFDSKTETNSTLTIQINQNVLFYVHTMNLDSKTIINLQIKNSNFESTLTIQGKKFYKIYKLNGFNFLIYEIFNSIE
jgi:hypothetical protein